MQAYVTISFDGRDTALGVHPRSNARNPQDRYEEDLYIGAMHALEEARKIGGVDFMMAAIRPLLSFYYLPIKDKDTLLEAWTKHFGPTILMEYEEK